MITKICNHCGKRVPIGQRCDCPASQRERDAEANKRAQRRYDRNSRDKEAAAFYHSDDWQAIRKAVWARAYGLDEYIYYTTGQAVPADTVHHIEPRSERPDLQYDLSNLIAVSRATHKRAHEIYRTDGNAALKTQMRASVGCIRV